MEDGLVVVTSLTKRNEVPTRSLGAGEDGDKDKEREGDGKSRVGQQGQTHLHSLTSLPQVI